LILASRSNEWTRLVRGNGWVRGKELTCVIKRDRVSDSRKHWCVLVLGRWEVGGAVLELGRCTERVATVVPVTGRPAAAAADAESERQKCREFVVDPAAVVRSSCVVGCAGSRRDSSRGR
jgi:hypothetical protein